MQMRVGGRGQKHSPLDLSVLKGLDVSKLKKISSISSDYEVYQCQLKKMNVVMHRIFVPKTRLLTNLQIYQWRCQTQFPIVKTYQVNIKQNTSQQLQFVQLEIYNEYCPLKLIQIYQISLAQCLFLLKESLIGFERLYDRFGGFDIQNSMININEKGGCCVWVSQNFALNLLTKQQVPEKKMVNKIITILESHTKETKVMKKFFATLKTCLTFLSSLKMIQGFTKQEKIMVPSRFVLQPTVKQFPRIQTSQSCKIIKNAGLLRFSVQERDNRISDCIGQSFKNGMINARLSCSPFEKRRLKSQNEISWVDALKKSEGETDYTGQKNKTSNLEINQNSLKEVKDKEGMELKKSQDKSALWGQNASYLMGQEDAKSNKSKKELSYSYAVERESGECLRKYSCQLDAENDNNSCNSNNRYFTGNQLPPNSTEVAKKEHSSEGKEGNLEVGAKMELVDDQDRLIEHHSRYIFQHNGWTSNVSRLLHMPTNFNESYHEGIEENIVRKEIKLEKLNLVGCQRVHESVMGDEQCRYFV